MQPSTQQMSFKCMKCSNQQCSVGEIHASGGFWSKIFNVQARKLKTVSCNQCGFTELYTAGKAGALGNIFDFLGN